MRSGEDPWSLAIDQAKLCSFKGIELWVQHLFLSHERAQPSGFASVTLQQIIECDKQMFIRASNNLVGQLQSEPGAAVTPLDKEIKALRTSPELMPYLMPMPVKPAPKASNTPKPDKRAASDASDRLTKYQKGKGEGKAKGSPNQSRVRLIFPKAVLQRQQMESHCALRSTKESVGTEDQGHVANVASTCATSRGATGPNHTTSAVTPKSDKRSAPAMIHQHPHRPSQR